MNNPFVFTFVAILVGLGVLGTYTGASLGMVFVSMMGAFMWFLAGMVVGGILEQDEK